MKSDTHDLPKTRKGWIVYYARKYSIVISVALCIGLVAIFNSFKQKHPELVKSKPSQIMADYIFPQKYRNSGMTNHRKANFESSFDLQHVKGVIMRSQE